MCLNSEKCQMKGEKSKMYIADEKRYETMKFRAS